MAQPSPSYPRTVRGLVTELEANGADALTMAAAFAEFSRTLVPPPPLDRTRTRKGTRVMASGVSTARRRAAEMARELSTLLAACPRILAALKPLTLAVPAAGVRTDPLYAPDADDPLSVVRNVANGAVTDHLTPGDPDVVRWWPRLPVGIRGQGLTLFDIGADALILDCVGPGFSGAVARNLVLAADTLQSVRAREAGTDQLARVMRGGSRAGGGHVTAGAARRAVRAAATTYGTWAEFLAPLVDDLAAQYGRIVQTLTDTLSALSIAEGLEMPSLTAANTAIADLATRIRTAIDEGHGGRLVVGNQEQAFSYVPGPAVTLLSYLSPGIVTGRTTTIVTARNAATVVGPVAEGGQKNNVVDFDSEDVNLKKFPGQCTITTEAAQFVNNIEAAVSTTIVGQVVRAIEADAAAVIAAAGGVAITDAADLTAGILSAIAAIRENGGSPNVVGLNSADWVELMTATGAAGGYTNMVNPEAGPGNLWGLAPVIIPGHPAGSAIVADGRSVTVSEPAGSPLAIVDPFTLAGTNKIVITIEAFAVTAVTSPGGVATVAVTVTP